jgi:hypothetical protein
MKPNVRIFRPLAALVFGVGSILVAGYSSPTRTLEWKGGVIMTEERHLGRPPRTWELKVVTGPAEMNALRKAGWKLTDGAAMLSTAWQRVDSTALRYVIHSDGGADTFLMKRTLDVQTSAPIVAAPPSFQPILITVFGTYPTPDGSWKIGVSEDSIDFAHPASGGVGFTPDSHGGKAQAGWFVFVESASRVWAYDGNHLLWLYVESHAETSSGCSIYPGVFQATNFDSHFPCAAPAEVISRLSEPAQKAIRHGQSL